MDRIDRLREDLAFIDRMIAECRHHIARLQTTTAETSGDGENRDPANTDFANTDLANTDLGNDVLGCFTAALTRYEAARNCFASAIEGDQRSAGEALLSVSAS
jgi:hypothetical protein